MKVHYLKPWLIFFVVLTLGGAVVGGIAGLAIGIVIAVAGGGSDPQTMRIAGKIAGYIASVPVSFLVYKWSVKKFILKQVMTDPIEEENSSKSSDPA